MVRVAAKLLRMPYRHDAEDAANNAFVSLDVALSKRVHRSAFCPAARLTRRSADIS